MFKNISITVKNGITTPINDKNKEEKEDRFKSIEESLQAFASLSIGEYFMYVINPNSAVFEYVSPQAKSILGYHPTEYTAELCVKIVHPDDLENVIDIQQKIANFNTEITPEEINGYTAKKIHELNPSFEPTGVYTFMELLRTDPKRAEEIIKGGFKNKDVIPPTNNFSFPNPFEDNK